MSSQCSARCSLQRELYNLAIQQASGPVRTAYSTVSPSSAVYQVCVLLASCALTDASSAMCTEGHTYAPCKHSSRHGHAVACIRVLWPPSAAISTDAKCR